mmetsp:Transcript_9305/g.27858  ORF Transcript_9305/g.27858 Transcript_9305/m.27858 type:complete len:469 (-) Transcript_9305:53-1459(-)
MADERTPLAADEAKEAGGGAPLTPISDEHIDDARPPQLSHTPTPGTKRKWRKKLLYLVAAQRFMEEKRLEPRGWVDGSRLLVTSTWLNALALLVLLLPFFRSPPAQFTLGCLALLPMATLLGDVTEKVAFHTSDTVGGLLNATFGNATEVIVSIFALRLGLVGVVQASLLGSVLSNMLLVLGCAFVAGGFKQKIVAFNRTAASANTSVLLVAVMAMLVPAVLRESAEITTEGVLMFSHWVGSIMLLVYLAYLYFQLSTHAFVFDEEEDKRPARSSSKDTGDRFAQVVLAAAHANQLPPFDGSHPALVDDDDDFVLDLKVAVGWLALLTLLISLLSDVVSGAIEGAAAAWGLSEAFVGFVLLPIVGNAAEHATAISMAYREKVDLAIAVALGSSTQISLFVIPFMVLFSWASDVPDDLTLDFPRFQTAMTFSSVVIVAFTVQVGEVTWLNGLVLTVCYVFIALSFLFIK